MCDKIDYLLDFKNPIINMLENCGYRDFNLVLYKMWDMMIEDVKVNILAWEEICVNWKIRIFLT